MSNYNDYIEKYKSYFKDFSNQAYGLVINSSAVLYGFDENSIIDEVCFARLYSHFRSKHHSANYLLRLPYPKEDKNDELHEYIVDYPVFFKNLQNLVEDTYNITIYNTGIPNTKFITIENKIDIPRDLDYCITLILYVLMRGVEGEYIRQILNSRTKLSGDLKEYLWWVSTEKRGSHHNINDSVDKITTSTKNGRESIKDLVVENYINVLKEVFGKDGLIHHPNFITYFLEIFNSKSQGYGYPMQTNCFDYIQRVYNRIKLEERK